MGAEQITPPSVLPTALLSIGFVEAKLADFAGTPSYGQRLADPNGYLAVSADFRGDGHQDQARVLRNIERNVAYVVMISVRSKIDTFVVKSVPLPEADRLGLEASPSLQAGRPVGLRVFSLDGTASQTFDLVGNDFVERDAASVKS